MFCLLALLIYLCLLVCKKGFLERKGCGIFFIFILCTGLVRTLQYFQNIFDFFAHENIKNRPQKLLIIGPSFSVLPTGPKPAQISIYFPKKIAHRATDA
jgi:hypothetical protein